MLKKKDETELYFLNAAKTVSAKSIHFAGAVYEGS